MFLELVNEMPSKVVKLFDTKFEPFHDPKGFELAAQALGADYLPELKTEGLCSGVVRVTYNYLQPTRARTRAQFCALVASLQTLHNAGLVHGDVREPNIVFM